MVSGSQEIRLMLRNRKAPSTPKERELLLLLVSRYLDVIACKETTGLASRRKALVWEKISRIFNRSPFVQTPATTSQLRKLWLNLKQKAAREKGEILLQSVLPASIHRELDASLDDAEDDKEMVPSSVSVPENRVLFEYVNMPSPESGEQAEGEAAAAGGEVGYEATVASEDGDNSAAAQISEVAGRVDLLKQTLRQRGARHRIEADHAHRMAQEEYRHKCTMNRLLEEEQHLKNQLLRTRLAEVAPHSPRDET